MSGSSLRRAASVIREADALFIGAGAGMGVDSGLPDFRGDKGFWRAYPPFQQLGLNFVDLANPAWFERDPKLAWGFYGHRLHLYRETVPHVGFEILKRWGETMDAGYFVFTSNVDGQFQAANYDSQRINECHGSIHHLQCTTPCSHDVWAADEVEVDVDEQTFRARPPLPHCSKCNTLARPNILMFADSRFIGDRSDAQQKRMTSFVTATGDKKLAIVECGAGTAVPSVRWQCERLADAVDATLIRINPREAQGPSGAISLAMGAEDALRRIDELLGE